MVMKVGLAWLEVRKTELLATKTLSIQCTARFSSTTPSSGLAAMRVVPN